MSGVPGYELHGVLVRGSACVRAYVRSDGFGRDWRVYWLSIKGQDTRARYYVGVAYRDPDILAALGRPGIRRSGLVPGAIEGFDSAVFAELELLAEFFPPPDLVVVTEEMRQGFAELGPPRVPDRFA